MTTLSALLSLPLIPFLVLIAIAAVAERWRLRGTGPALVLQKFSVNESESGESLVVIKGRPSGLISWLLTIAGLSAETSLTITRYDIFVEGSSLSGFRAQYVPMHDVASAECSYFRSVLLLVLSFGVYALGFIQFFGQIVGTRNDYDRLRAYGSLWPILFVCALVGSAFYMAYALSKRINISVESSGGKRIGISFKRSVIENVSVELPAAMRAVDLLNRQILLTPAPR